MWKIVFLVFLCIGCAHISSDMIYMTNFPMTVRVNTPIEWEVVTSMRADSLSWTMYLTHGPLSTNMQEYWMRSLNPIALWHSDMFSVKGVNSEQVLDHKLTIPPLELIGHYKIYLNVWNDWFKDERVLYMHVRDDGQYESLAPEPIIIPRL